jgi:hypothetical protein
MTDAMPGDVFTRSQRLSHQKFAGVLEQNLGEGERVLLVDDCDAEIFEISQPTPRSGLVALLSCDRLLLLRGRGVLGAKRPWVMELVRLEQLGITAEGNLNLRFSDPNGEPHLWKLIFRDALLAERWMRELEGACKPDTPDEDLHSRLYDCLDSLAPLAVSAQVGRPFAAGAGLETAIERVQAHLRNAEEVRSCDRMAIVELLAHLPGEEPARTALEVMGADTESDDGVVEAARELGGAAVELIRQFREPDKLWALWEERDDVALELFAWHCVARLRLATAGVMPAVGAAAASGAHSSD